MKKIVEFVLIYLEMIRKSVENSSEANRRLAINIFLMVISNLKQLSIHAEYHFSDNEFNKTDWRVGTGPLDYYLSYPMPSSSTITSAPKRAGYEEKEKASSSSPSATQLLQDMLFTSVGSVSSFSSPCSGTIPLIVSSDKDEKKNEDEGEREEEEESEKDKEAVESNKKKLTDYAQVNKGSGQNVAQMIDAIKAIKVARTKRAVHTASASEDGPIVIKGVLSTSQDSLFFILRDRSSTNQLPLLEFIGRFSVKIFQRETGRSSGLEAYWSIKELDYADIAAYLKNLYCFLTLE